MAEAELPLKKQKLWVSTLQYPPPPLQPAPPTPPPLTPEEIQQRRRNKEEIRNVYECYKRIKFCIDRNEKREIEEAYLCLIASARGGASVQRLLAEYIPRFASYCPTALEAAAKVVVNIHNRWIAVINKAQDVDGIAFEIAKACIFGLVDICHAAASEAPTSGVFQRICSSVFLNVFTFFITYFEGQDIFHVVDEKILTIHNSTDSFFDFKREVLEEDSSVLLKLSKFRALSLLRIFFNHSKKSAACCFELMESTRTEEFRTGKYFFHQLTNELNDLSIGNIVEGCDGNKSTVDSTGGKYEPKHRNDDYITHGNSISNHKSTVLKNCLLGLVFTKDPTFRSWIFSRCKKFCNCASSEVATHVTSVLEGVFESFVQQLTKEDSYRDGDDDMPSSKYVSQHIVSRISSQKGSPSVATGRDFSDKGSNAHFKNGGTIKSNINHFECEDSKSMDFHHGDSGDLSNARTFTQRDFLNRQTFSPSARTAREFRSNSFPGRVNVHMERSPISNMDFPATALRSSSVSSNASFDSPNHDVLATQYCDGDTASMDVFSASKQLWVGSLGPDASEMLVRFMFEKFGQVDHLQHFPYKGYALIDYRNLMDAVKARDTMRGRSPWGSCLHIKFFDMSLGTRGAVNGVAVGSSCHVYIGHVPNKWAKDEIIREVKHVLHKGPHMITDLSNEGALLLEFDSPKEAVISMSHLRWYRKENCNFGFPSSSACTPNLRANVDIARTGSALVDARSNYLANNMIGSPHAQSVLEKPYDSYMTRPTGNPVKHHGASPSVRSDGSGLELTSPRTSQENFRPMMQNVHAFQSTWTDPGMHEVRRTGPTNQTWMYGKPGTGIPSDQGSMAPMPTHSQVPVIAPPQPGQASGFVRPLYAPPNNLWDARGLSHHIPPNPSPCVRPANSIHGRLQAPPFLSASVTPLAKIQGSSMPQLDQMYSLPGVPPPLPCLAPANMAPALPPSEFRPLLPPHPDFRPPLPQPELQPPLPPPPPTSLPPVFPPPPSSPPPLPPPPPPTIPADSVKSGPPRLYPQSTWQGILSKSGVYYCIMLAERVDSVLCSYSNKIAEPTEWPAKLDMTKRTDFRHVKSTFSSTPPHRREVCWLLPSSQGDHKGFQDFVSYLKQRDCAGVIKIPAAKSMWSRLLFILPYSPEVCAMLSIPPNHSLCLIGLILPKETNAELV